MYQLSYKMFLNSLNIHSTRLLDKVSINNKGLFQMSNFMKSIQFKIEPPNSELMPNEDLRQTLVLLKDIFDSYNNSVVSIETKKDDYIRVSYSIDKSYY